MHLHPALAHPPCKQAGPAGLGRYRRSPNHGDNAPVAKKKSTNPKLRVEYVADAPGRLLPAVLTPKGLNVALQVPFFCFEATEGWVEGVECPMCLE